MSRHALYFGALLGPLVLWVGLRAAPSLDVEFLARTFHLALMTVIALCALFVAAMAAGASAKIREPGVVLLASGCSAVGLLLLGHGLTTPFVLGQPVNQWVARFPYLALAVFALCLALAATNWSKRSLAVLGRHPLHTIVGVVVPTATLVAVVSLNPAALYGAEPLGIESDLRNLIAYPTMLLLVPVSWLYWRRFRLGLDIVHASLAVSAAMTAVAMMSLHFGELWRLSWWDYHGCLLAGFAGVAYAVFRRWRATRTAASVLVHAFENDPLTLISTNYPSALKNLVETMETKDTYTHGHSARTATLAVSIGVRMGLDADDLRTLAQGSYLHDIGKLAIPDEILNKPAALTPAERQVINTHPAVGCDLASAHRVLAPCLPIIRHHHERFDGTGYPDGLTGRETPILARIAAVADVWDALITDRAYRPGWAPQRALDHIVEGAGKHLDPQVVAVLLDIASDMGITPSGLGASAGVIDHATSDCHESGTARTDLTGAVLQQVRAAITKSSPS